MSDTLITTCPVCKKAEECEITDAGRGRHKLKLKCPKGHEFVEGNDPPSKRDTYL